ncbi:hypothetical protein JIN85_16870 [Luteolibacter pohnpeiensis]|uniref:Uncharacterized protein n=1 Tax=Luteolibacter pohnpeiensis TaxID=454153 RepID=A0A934S6Q4_9BACT|nr:hypothetical protein [Luteolibacter pohnpeiensis]MBK1884095.1 hypothetical protein [Luteolibacter pohnpeiensis]
MADEFKYQLVFDTALNPKGSDAAVAALQKIEKAKNDTNDASGRFLTAAEAEVAEVERLVAGAQRLKEENQAVARSGNQIEDFLRRTTREATKTEVAFYDLDAEMARTTASSSTFSTGATKVGKSSADASRSLLLFSQGFEDAQYGIRGVLNNIPGLVLAMGGTAGLAGAISIAAVSFSILFDRFKKTKEEAKVLTDSLDEIISNAGKLEADRVAAVSKALTDSKEAAAALKQDWQETKKAESEYSESLLTNAEKSADAQRKINILLGNQVDKYREIDELEKAASKRRQTLAKREIDDQLLIIAKARELVTELNNQTSEKEIQRDLEQAELVKQIAILQTLREQQKASREKLAAEYRNTDDPGSQLLQAAADGLGFPELGPLPTVEQSLEKAKAQEDPTLRAEIKAQEEKISVIQDNIKDLSEQARQLVNSTNQAETKAADTIKAANLRIESIQQIFEGEEINAKADSVTERSKLLASQLKEELEKISSATDQQSAAKDSISKATADHIIAANEIQQLSAALVTLTGGLQSGVSTTNENLQTVLATMMKFQADSEKLRKDFEAFKLRK